MAGDPVNNQAPPYWLYVYKKNDGTKASLDSVGNLNGAFHIRMRFDDYKIYFEYSTNNGSSWILLYDEFFDLPGYTLDDRFYYEIAATNTPVNGKLQVDDFATVKDNSTAEKEILVDGLTDSVFVNGANDPNQSLRVDRFNVGSNSNFSASGWKPTTDADLVHYDLGRYLEKGSLEITVTQFEPRNQNTMERHHVLAMFRMPWGSHHVVEDLETDWDLHTGTFYSIQPPTPGVSGVKLYSVTHFYNQIQYDEKQSITPLQNPTYAPQHDWNRGTQYTIKIVWSDKSVAYYRNNVLQKAEDSGTGTISDIVHSHTKDFELRYVYVGRDRTVSGDIETNYNGEYGTNGGQYKAMWSNGQGGKPNGPVYSSIKVKQIVSATDAAGPVLNNISHTTFANGVRLSWTTNEAAACYVNYGVTTSYGSKTTVLGPLNKNHSTSLAGLAANQTYHYQIVAVDSAGNKTVSANQTFKTQSAGVYIFKPVADTYIEQNNDVAGYSHLYGITRAFGNYGWMNLMTAKGRICYLKFNVTGVTGTFNQATLQLYGRQGGNGGIKLKTFTPTTGHASDWEFNLTGASFTEVDTLQPLKYSAAEWGDFNMDGTLDLLLTGQQTTSGQVTKVYRNNNVGTNYDLAVYSAPTLIGVKYGDLAWGNFNNDRYLDILLSGWGTGSGYATRVYQGDSSGAGGSRNWKHNTSITLPQLRYSSVAWGDNDGDGWLDLLVAGTHSTNNDSIKIFRNKKNSNGTRGFLPATFQPPQAKTASVAWANFEGEDYLDIAFAGQTNATTKVYQRTGSGYVPVDTTALLNVKQGTVAWGDYDNDGDLDLLVTGEKSDGSARVSKIYRTDKYTKDNIKFVDIGAPLTGVHNGAAAWADYDNDGDLDILIAGNTTASDSTGRTTKIYENLLNVPNTTPTAPTGLTVTYSAADSLYTLKWNKSTDNQTPQAALTYNVMIGTTSNGTEILSPMANKFTGKRWLPAPGNAGTKDYYLLNRCGLNNGTYYWKVQAIDNVWKGSAFSVEDTFMVTNGPPKVAATDSSAIAQQAIPKTFALSQNYPNPFNPSTRLNLNLPENGRVKAIVYNIIGQEVARLQDGAMTAGYRYLNWDGRSSAGVNVSSGIYLVKVVFEGVSGTRKEATSRVLLLK